MLLHVIENITILMIPYISYDIYSIVIYSSVEIDRNTQHIYMHMWGVIRKCEIQKIIKYSKVLAITAKGKIIHHSFNSPRIICPLPVYMYACIYVQGDIKVTYKDNLRKPRT